MVGGKTELFLKSDRYDMTLEGVLIEVTDKHSGQQTYVTLMSTEWFKKLDEPKETKKTKVV